MTSFTKTDLSELSTVVRPRFRLFLSADLVGSTRLKQVRQEFSTGVSFGELEELPTEEKDEILSQYRPAWFTAIESFFLDFKRVFLNELEIARDGLINSDETSPQMKKRLNDDRLNVEVWKTIGDEIIFVSEVYDSDQIAMFTLAFRMAIIYFRRISQLAIKQGAELPVRSFYLGIQDRKTYVDLGIDVKCAMWTAAFPATNKEIISRRVETEEQTKQYQGHNPTISSLNLLRDWYEGDEISRSNLTRDFIGPSIDTGFRVSEFSHPSRLVISLDVAYLLSVSDLGSMASHEAPIHFSGRSSMKGVIGGDAYPIFWVDCSIPNGLADLEGQILSQPGPIGRELVEKFCLEFYKQHRKFIHPPRIPTDHNEKISGIPNNHFAFLSNLDSIWTFEWQRFEGRADFGG